MSLQTVLHLSRLRKNLRRKPSELEKMQIKKLRAIVRHAYRDIPFYHRKFKNARPRKSGLPWSITATS